jgi:hypothetical protein
MSRVEIKKASGLPPTLTVDGVDLSFSVLADGFKVEFVGNTAHVHMVIAADVLELDLPYSVIAALREESGDE